MVGGFLGAGKTTAILDLAQKLHARGTRVGLITNDQSFGLVDTALLSSKGLPVEEITGGCFCCRFQSLMDAAGKLTEANAPDVFIAEPVGSCTDLRAAVSYPLRRIYGDSYEIAPLSVLVDPIRAGRILGLEVGKAFSEKVLYVYDKQLEEADIIIINKTDLLDAPKLDRLKQALAAKYPQARIVAISARSGDGAAEWHRHILDDEMNLREAPEVDYEVYAEGEALLGWLNAAAKIESDTPFDGNALLRRIADSIQSAVVASGGEIAHLKMTLSPGEGNDLAVLNVVRGDQSPESIHRLHDDLENGELLINLRAEADPDRMREIVLQVLSSLHPSVRVNIVHTECFRPAKPQPTYRLATI
ncbi:MAG: cobalamin biosynthesis protein P47K [Bryobacterales bacterium]|nr:cobalamin biosynthesis protein P47K [Bryobacterales bacterium]